MWTELENELVTRGPHIYLKRYITGKCVLVERKINLHILGNETGSLIFSLWNNPKGCEIGKIDHLAFTFLRGDGSIILQFYTIWTPHFLLYAIAF